VEKEVAYLKEIEGKVERLIRKYKDAPFDPLFDEVEGGWNGDDSIITTSILERKVDEVSDLEEGEIAEKRVKMEEADEGCWVS